MIESAKVRVAERNRDSDGAKVTMFNYKITDGDSVKNSYSLCVNGAEIYQVTVNLDHDPNAWSAWNLFANLLTV